MKSLLFLLISLPLLADQIFTESFVTPPHFRQANHGASIVSLPDSSLLTCWYAGERESARDVQIFCSKSLNKGMDWSSPKIVVKVGETASGSWFSNKTVGNVSLYLDEDKILWMFYSAVVFGGWSGSHVDYKTSKNFGDTWSESQRYISSYGNLPRNKPIKISKNKFFLPLYHEFTHFQGYGCMIETEAGSIKNSRCFDIPGSKHGQPTFIKMDENKVFAYLRTKELGQTLFSQFDLTKKLWTVPVSLTLPNPDSALDGVKTSLGVLLVTNYSKNSRIPLSLVLSKDGYHFEKIFDFETEVESAYPTLIQEEDEFYLVYTYNGRAGIKMVHFNQEWLTQKIK